MSLRNRDRLIWMGLVAAWALWWLRDSISSNWKWKLLSWLRVIVIGVVFSGSCVSVASISAFRSFSMPARSAANESLVLDTMLRLHRRNSPYASRQIGPSFVRGSGLKVCQREEASGANRDDSKSAIFAASWISSTIKKLPGSPTRRWAMKAMSPRSE
jgi:hypothetical protein